MKMRPGKPVQGGFQNYPFTLVGWLLAGLALGALCRSWRTGFGPKDFAWGAVAVLGILLVLFQRSLRRGLGRLYSVFDGERRDKRLIRASLFLLILAAVLVGVLLACLSF